MMSKLSKYLVQFFTKTHTAKAAPIHNMLRDGKAIQIKASDLDEPKHVYPGDTFNLTFTEHRMNLPSGLEYDSVWRMSEEIKEEMVINRVAMFIIKDELGFESALCGAFGKKQENEQS